MCIRDRFKKKHIERFLSEGDKVKATIFFRGREMAHPEIGRRILERLIGELGEAAIVESAPRQEGNQMHTILAQRSGKSQKGSGGSDARRSAPQTAGVAAGGARTPAADSPGGES